MKKNNENHLPFIDSKIGPNLKRFLRAKKYQTYYILCDSNTLEHCLGDLILECPELKEAEIIELEPGEESKDLSVVSNIWQTLTEFAADKKSLLINLGGGVISDVGGFAATLYKRGIDHINVPTSLLAMADASVGGKNGINFSGIKNMIGTINAPSAVFISPRFLKTLPTDHLISGFAEILKVALIQDKKFFRQISGLSVSPSSINLELIKKSVALKNKIVKQDPDEKGLRKILNFGHTIGHAMESLFLEKSQPLLHGQAVAIGMAIESYLCRMKKRIEPSEFQEIIHSLQLNFEFPPITQSETERFFHYFRQDKKHSGKTFQLALLKDIGQCEYDVKISATDIEKALNYYNHKIANGSHTR
jgi:3-dehydroquinate synthase